MVTGRRRADSVTASTQSSRYGMQALAGLLLAAVAV